MDAMDAKIQDLPEELQDLIFSKLFNDYGDFYSYNMELKTLHIGVQRFLESFEQESSLCMLAHLCKDASTLRKIVLHTTERIYAPMHGTGKHGSAMSHVSEDVVHGVATRLLETVVRYNSAVKCTIVIDAEQSFEDFLHGHLQNDQ